MTVPSDMACVSRGCFDVGVGVISLFLGGRGLAQARGTRRVLKGSLSHSQVQLPSISGSLGKQGKHVREMTGGNGVAVRPRQRKTFFSSCSAETR